jgi:hypothetical protein
MAIGIFMFTTIMFGLQRSLDKLELCFTHRIMMIHYYKRP